LAAKDIGARGDSVRSPRVFPVQRSVSEAMSQSRKNQVPGAIEILIDLLAFVVVLPTESLETHTRSLRARFVKE